MNKGKQKKQPPRLHNPISEMPSVNIPALSGPVIKTKIADMPVEWQV